jgi:hypothetical protein
VLSFAHARFDSMATSSVSFRITRHAEDLAQTIHALSQRLVLLEQRLAVIEDQLTSREEEPPSEQLASLANVDQLLRDCRELLAADPPKGGASSLELQSAGAVSPSVAGGPMAAMEEAA